jgi:hypothetical protein
MRFRSKFEWPLLAGSVMWFGLSLAWFHKQPHEAIGWAYLFIGIVQLLLAAWVVVGYFLFWWEVGESGLVQRMFWSERTIPWEEITRVGHWGKRKWTRDCLFVAYARTGPMSDRGELRIQPVEFDALVSALRDHAPQAEFDLLPAAI